MKNCRYIFSFLVMACASIAFVGCEDEVQPIEELEFSRTFSPLGLQAFVRNNTTIELNWTPDDEVETYVVEFSEDSLEFSSIIFTNEVTAADLPYQHTFAGETRYSARVKALGTEGKEDSKWSVVTIETSPENIFLALPGENVGETTTTLLWQAGAEVTHFLIMPEDVERTITAEEKAAGEATLEDLDDGTVHTVTLYNGNKRRGIMTFETQLAANVFPTDDLAAAIANADEGAILVLAPGDYTMGAVALAKSITIQGQKPHDKPKVVGQLACGVAVTSVTLKSIVFRGDDPVTPYAQFFNTVAGCNLTSLTVDDCEVSHYANQIIYNNAAGVYGTVTLKGSFFHDIPGGGGDGIDFRGGTIGALQVENCTFANGFRTFLRMQVTCNTSFRNCTFYKVCTPDNSNNAGLFRANVGGTFEAINCLFAETGVAAPVNTGAGNFVRNATNMAAIPTYDNNNIFGCLNLLVGLYTTASAIDATELNPAFADAANNNFKVTNQTLIDRNVGDQSWAE